VAEGTNEYAPLVVLTVIGILVGGGWMVVLNDTPEEAEAPSAKVLAPAPLPSGPTPVDEAIAAVARSGDRRSIRCELHESAPVKLPFEIAHYADGMLRAVVSTERGTRLLWSAPEDDTEPQPLGLLEWSGAQKDAVGGCRVVPTSSTRIEGTVTVDGKPATDIRVRVCGETLLADANGAFHASAWAGQHCLAYVSEPGITQDFEPIIVPMNGPAKVTLEAQKMGKTGSGTLTDRRVLVPRTSWPEKALRQEGLSAAAQKVLQDWARDDLAEEVARTEVTEELEALEAPVEAEPTP
jgi:hypothetical protein